MFIQTISSFLSCFLDKVSILFDSLEFIIKEDGHFTINLHKTDLKKPVLIEGVFSKEKNRFESISLIVIDCHDGQFISDLVQNIDDFFYGILKQKAVSAEKQEELGRKGENLTVWG